MHPRTGARATVPLAVFHLIAQYVPTKEAFMQGAVQSATKTDPRPLSTREDERHCTACGRKTPVTVAMRRSYSLPGLRPETFISIECEPCSRKDDAEFWGLPRA